MQAAAFNLVERFLEEIFKDVFTKSMPSIAGPLQDSTAVAIPTFVAGIFGGPIGAVFGAFFGSTVLGISKACGYGHYKPLMVALKEDFSETERNDLYERTWKKLESFVTSPLTQNVVFIALHELVRAADVNPKLVDSVRDEINRTLNLKKMVLG